MQAFEALNIVLFVKGPLDASMPMQLYIIIIYQKV